MPSIAKPLPDSLYYGDCLDVMGGWPNAFVDLCYLDPPFNSKANYNILFGKSRRGNRPQVMAFEDTWHWDASAAQRVDNFQRALANPAHDAIMGLQVALGESGMMAYLSYMAERLVEIRRVLKPTGSIYLHCDPTASHYLKVVMDAIFGQRNFRNEIVWCYQRWTGASKHFQRMHDCLLFYAGSPEALFNMLEEPYSSKSKHKGARHSIVRDGRLDQSYIGDTRRLKAMRDVWEISYLNSQAKERLGYPTQKPLALLERIIKASSSRGDVVLDPFCGCGTTVVAARNLNRRWIGIDISPFAIDLVKVRRLQDKSIPVNGIPVSLDSARQMARDKPFDFEKWAITRIPGLMPNTVQVGDGGIDGRGHLLDAKDGLVLAQVKGGQFSASAHRDFLHVLGREKAAMGIYITLDKVRSRAAAAESRRLGSLKLGARDYPKAQFWSIADYFDEREPRLPPLADPFTGKGIQQSLL